MARGVSGFGRPLRMLFEAGAVGGLSDAQLLDRFVERDGLEAERAFEALVDRHGPMVLATCRSLLGDRHEAEDAFQATFLVLARRAGSIGRRASVAAWLHGVACRVCRKARRSAIRRRDRERRVAEDAPSWGTDGTPDDLSPVLHEELGRLPESYRAPIVLCYLEGLTHEQAATRLGWPVGTVRGRMARARGLLRTRLARRGLAPGAVGAFSATVAARGSIAAVPGSLIDSTARVAAELATGSAALAGAVPDRVVSLAQGVLTSMRWNVISKTLLVAMPAAALAVGVGVGVVSARQGDGSATIPPPLQIDPPPAAEAPAVASHASGPGPGAGTGEAGTLVAQADGESPAVPESGRVSFSEYEIPEDFNIAVVLEDARAVEQSANLYLMQGVNELDQYLVEVRRVRQQIAEAIDLYRDAFEIIRTRRDAVKAAIAGLPPVPDGVDIRSQGDAEILGDLDEFLHQLGAIVQGLEVELETYDVAIRRVSIIRDAFAGDDAPAPSPTTGTLPPPDVEPPALDPATRRTSAELSPADPRDRRLDALERKLDEVLEALLDREG